MRLLVIASVAIVLFNFARARGASSGPASGGNTLTIAGTGLGNGSDIKKVTICGLRAAIKSQTANSVTVVVGAGGSGTGNILVYSASAGETTFSNGYTYNPPGAIFGALVGWSSISNLPSRRTALAAASVDGKIYAIGGASGALRNNLAEFHSTVYVYDPSQPSLGWLSESKLPEVRWTLAAASVNGKIYAIGGLDRTFNGQSTVYVYDPLQPKSGWSNVSNLPIGVSGLAAVSVGGKIYAIGGFGNFHYYSNVYVYDPSQPSLGWLSVSNLPGARVDLGVTSVNGKIYAIGGMDRPGSIQSTVYVYDPSQPAQGWLSVSNLPEARFDLAAASVNGKIYAVGGADRLGNPQSTVYVYDPSKPTQGWLSFSNLPAASMGNAAVGVNGNIYSIGGNNRTIISSTVYGGSFASGVVPDSGPLPGGDAVVVSGNNLGNGDVTNVTLCGIPAAILADNSPTQIVVSAGAAAFPGQGNVVVRSSSYGVTVASNAFTYLPPAPDALPATNVTTRSFYANWSGVRGATQYLLDVSTTINFTADVARYTNLNVGNAKRFWVHRLNPATTYYYRVRCQQNEFTSDNSSTISVQTLGDVSVSSGLAWGGNTLTKSTGNDTTAAINTYTYLQPPTIVTAFDGTKLQLSWPTNCIGWGLEAQTNGLGTNWFPLDGSTATNQFLILVNPANGCVFYRLRQQ